MIPELKKYIENGTFVYTQLCILSKVCNAPATKAGLYLVYAVTKNHRELVYIGQSGRIDSSGNLFIRKDGIYGRLVKGKRDGILRRKYWMTQMQNNNIDYLEFNWYVTHSENYIDCPLILETQLVDKYKPAWNR